ncbi:MAG: hypothetical protein V3573_02180 [Desulfovibrionaceae bacterium]
MQQRYCQCGAAFMVAYLANGPERVRVHILAASRAGLLTVHHCPCCGKRVDIHSLR